MRKCDIRLFACLLILTLGCSHPEETPPTGPSVCYDSTCFSVELAISPAEHEEGLMYRTELPPERGMLFIFAEVEVYAFWMKNTLIPLDIIWLDQAGRVVHIARAVPCTTDPCDVYNPSGEALYVLELAAGSSQRIGLSEGSAMRFVGIAPQDLYSRYQWLGEEG